VVRRGLIDIKTYAVIVNYESDYTALAHKTLALAHGKNTGAQAARRRGPVFAGAGLENDLAGLRRRRLVHLSHCQLAAAHGLA
jgi:hypothetical protein